MKQCIFNNANIHQSFYVLAYNNMTPVRSSLNTSHDSDAARGSVEFLESNDAEVVSSTNILASQSELSCIIQQIVRPKRRNCKILTWSRRYFEYWMKKNYSELRLKFYSKQCWLFQYKWNKKNFDLACIKILYCLFALSIRPSLVFLNINYIFWYTFTEILSEFQIIQTTHSKIYRIAENGSEPV